jgi:hypothetical protein
MNKFIKVHNLDAGVRLVNISAIVTIMNHPDDDNVVVLHVAGCNGMEIVFATGTYSDFEELLDVVQFVQ